MTEKPESIYKEHPLANHPMSAIEWNLKDAKEARDIWNKVVVENHYKLPAEQLWRSPEYQTYSKYADQVHDLLGIRRDKLRGLLPSPSDEEWSSKPRLAQQAKQEKGPFPFSIYPGESGAPSDQE